MRLLLVIALALTSSWLQAQAEWPRPTWKKVEALACRESGPKVLTSVGNYKVRLAPVPTSQSGVPLCRAYLIDSLGRETFLYEDRTLSIYEGTGQHIFGDGNPALILEGRSGDACCYTYKLVSLGEPPLLLPAIENEAPFFFFHDPASHEYRIMTSDGGFHNFDGLCFACSPFPRVVLKVGRSGLHDVSPEFSEQYDSEIALARAKIAEGSIEKFLEADFRDARKVVLEIVLSYLYSGREKLAWETLEEMWPAKDRERMKQLIIQTRAKGILSRLEATKPELAAAHTQ